MSASSSTLMVSYLQARKLELYEKMLGRSSNQQSLELYREYEEVEERLRRCTGEFYAITSTGVKRKQLQEHGEDAVETGCTTGGADMVMEDCDVTENEAAPSPKRQSKKR